MARQYWPNGDAIGRQFRLPDPERRAAVFANGRGRRRLACNHWVSSPTRAMTASVIRSNRRSMWRIHVEDADVHPDPRPCAGATAVDPCATCAPKSFASIANSRSCACAISHSWITNLQEYSQQKLVARLFGDLERGWPWPYRRSGSTAWCPTASPPGPMSSGSGWRWEPRARDVVRMVLSGTSWNVGRGTAGRRGAESCAFDKPRITVGEAPLGSCSATESSLRPPD